MFCRGDFASFAGWNEDQIRKPTPELEPESKSESESGLSTFRLFREATFWLPRHIHFDLLQLVLIICRHWILYFQFFSRFGRGKFQREYMAFLLAVSRAVRWYQPVCLVACGAPRPLPFEVSVGCEQRMWCGSSTRGAKLGKLTIGARRLRVCEFSLVGSLAQGPRAVTLRVLFILVCLFVFREAKWSDHVLFSRWSFNIYMYTLTVYIYIYYIYIQVFCFLLWWESYLQKEPFLLCWSAVVDKMVDEAS